ncbi:MAG: glycosyltransferase [Actinobacteria bacterium]|nr:glycosyltransferase [Actinomycetota bacterium]
MEMGGKEGRRPDLVSVVIPAHNAGRTIGAQLAALASQTYTGPFEIVVSDNGSTDDTRRVVEAWTNGRPTVRAVDSSDRRGASHARNVGTEASDGALIAYCDADDVAHPNWLASLVEALSHADLVGGALEHALLNDGVVVAWRGADLGAEALPGPVGFLPFALSANLAVKKAVWRFIAGWNEDYEHGGDDVDFCWRAQIAGAKLAFAPEAIMHYRHRDSLPAAARQVYNYGRGEVRLYRDYRHLGLARRELRDIAGSCFYLLSRLPFLPMSPRRRGYWLVMAATAWGHIVGSVRYRVLYL